MKMKNGMPTVAKGGKKDGMAEHHKMMEIRMETRMEMMQQMMRMLMDRMSNSSTK